jgi:Leucine-rich repeat (LRR) protein
VRQLQGLAFLDVAQNKIRDLESGIFESMDSLTALNLERNAIQSLDPQVFDGVTDTLSSLSLLNNMLTEFPILALRTLPKLRVRVGSFTY